MANYWKHIGMNENFGIVNAVQAIRGGKNSNDIEFTTVVAISPTLTLEQSNALKALSSNDLEAWVESRCDLNLIDKDLVQQGDTPKEARIMEES